VTQNWEVHLQFKVHGSGKNLFGDGMAFWYTSERMQMGKELLLSHSF
jgi:mannose-binding lectin 2